MTALTHQVASSHGVHAVIMVGPALAVTLLALGADARAWLNRRGRPVPAPATLAAAGLSSGAALIHAGVCPQHLREGLLYGQFFAATAVAQLSWAGLVILRSRRWLFAAGLAGNLAIIGLWAITRSIGIPFGPHAGQIETVGDLDVITITLEAAIVAYCAWMLPQAHRHPAAATNQQAIPGRPPRRVGPRQTSPNR
jgi:hypothetical protein